MFGTVIIFPNSANFGRIVWNSEKVVFLERAVGLIVDASIKINAHHHAFVLLLGLLLLRFT